jgi:hypothetical protein
MTVGELAAALLALPDQDATAHYAPDSHCMDEIHFVGTEFRPGAIVCQRITYVDSVVEKPN